MPKISKKVTVVLDVEEIGGNETLHVYADGAMFALVAKEFEFVDQRKETDDLDEDTQTLGDA